jgi:cyclase
MTATLLKKRLIPKLLIKHRQMAGRERPVLVTTKRYSEVLDVGEPVSQAKIYEAQLADELIVLNIDGTPIAGDEVMLSLIERLASENLHAARRRRWSKDR